MAQILERARCQPVMLDGSSGSGSLQWGPEEVSPMCNCLRNLHVQYIKVTLLLCFA